MNVERWLAPLAAALLIDTSSPASLESQLRRTIESSGAEVAVAYRTLDGKSALFIDGDKPFHAASTMKVPVKIELFRQAAACGSYGASRIKKHSTRA